MITPRNTRGGIRRKRALMGETPSNPSDTTSHLASHLSPPAAPATQTPPTTPSHPKREPKQTILSLKGDTSRRVKSGHTELDTDDVQEEKVLELLLLVSSSVVLSPNGSSVTPPTRFHHGTIHQLYLAHT